MEGWIKSHRSVIDNPLVCKDADHYAVWGYLLHKAVHAETPALFGGKKIMLHPGQLITGRKVIAAHFGINEYKVYRILNLFKSEQQIAQQTSNVNSLISITNWAKYQGYAQPVEQQMHNDCTTDAQQMHTYKECKNIRIEELAHTQEFLSDSFSRAREEISPGAEKSAQSIERDAAAANFPEGSPEHRAVRFLGWLHETYPDIAGMEEPLTFEQSKTLCCKFQDDDIVRIVEAMHNKGVAERNRSAYSTFATFIRNDRVLKDRRARKIKYYTHGQVCDMVRDGYTNDQFEIKVIDGQNYWYLKIDKINQQ